MSAAPQRLEVTGVSKRFGTMEALKDVSISIGPGEIRGLCGHNGAGKSTLINVITGLVSPDAGEIRIDGRRLKPQSPREAQGAGIAWVAQELSLIPSLTIAENITLCGRDGGVVRSRRQERATASELLAGVGLGDQDPGELVAGLSLGKRQLVEIARALGRGASLLILDEPTATLTDFEIKLVFSAVRQVAERGCAVMFVSHRLGELLSLCDFVTVMRDGSVVDERPAGQFSADSLIETMLGEQLELAPHTDRAASGELLLRVSELSIGSRVTSFSHEFKAGCVYGVAGQVGAGASEVLRALAGQASDAVGEVELAGRRLSLRNPVRNRRHGIGFVTNDRKADGLFLTRSVRENLTVSRLAHVSRGGVLSVRQERTQAAALAEEAGVDAERLGASVELLSGGNQQRALVGRFLRSSDVKVLLVDEPTRGVDVGGRAAIHRLLTRIAGTGTTVIFATSDLEELLELAMVVITMRAGRIVGVYEEGVTRQEMLADLTHRADGSLRAETEILT
jgi:ABC-type sugar transport system ATPase subunit